MLEQQHFKKVHIVIFAFILFCVLITFQSLIKGEYQRVAQERQAASELLQETINLSLKSYEIELAKFVEQLKTSKVDSSNDFHRFVQSFKNANEPVVEHVFFTQYKRGQNAATNNVSSIYSFPDLSSLDNNLTPAKDFYKENALSLLKSKNALLSAPLALIDRKSTGTTNQATTDFFILARALNNTSSSHAVVGISFKFDDFLNSMNFTQFNRVLFRIADVTHSDHSEHRNTEAIQYFYQSTLAKPDSWKTENINRIHLLVNGREWLVESRFVLNDFDLLNWSTVVLPTSLLLLAGLLLHLYIVKVSNSYKRVLLSMNRQAEIDPLTRLSSRYSIYESLNKSLDIALQDNSKIAVICLDLDHFKTINDAFNHDVGDKMLEKVAQRLLSVLPNEATVGRLGGDEFLAFFAFDSSSSQDDIKALCDEIITQLSQSYFIDRRMLTVGCSIGIAIAPDYGNDAVTLVKNADMAMYKAKNAGRATYHFYDGSIGDQLARNARIETRLRLAMQNNELQMYFQPKVNLVTLECVGLEALLRWEDSELGVVSPAEFIPIAEQSGIILPLGEWVIDQSCRQIAQWREDGLTVPPIAINCSAAQFRRHDFLSKLLNSLHDFDVLPPQIELEVTESILIEDPENCSNLLRQVSNLGMKITIDDFGTGYSSLSYLRDLPFDCIKIDQAFIRDIMEDDSHAALTNAIIKMGQSLNLQIVAEGITTHAQLDYLRSLGCDIGQGFLFGEAFHADQLSNNVENIELSLSNDTDQ